MSEKLISDNTWPSGMSAPDLTVTDGQIVRLGAYQVFGTLTVEAGGQIELVQDGFLPFFVGCTGDVVIRGTITVRAGSAPPPLSVILFPTPDGHIIAPYAQGPGGDGGNALDGAQPATDVPFAYTGNGAGGSGTRPGAYQGGAPTQSQGGAGGAGTQTGGQGAQLYSGAGGNGATGYLASGGGGGSRGRHGGALYIRVLGNVDLVGGMSDAAGEDGGAGGAASDWTDPLGNPVAGGGGGGAGGNGGVFHIVYGGTFLPGNFNVSAGRGGQGGPASRNVGTSAHGSAGSDGQNGLFLATYRPAGSLSIVR